MRDPLFPFWHLGLRCNPFRALAADEWSAVALLPPAVAAASLHPAAHLQLLGPMGAGKTTTLLGLARQFEAAGQRVAYEYLALGTTSFRSDLSRLDVLLLDEAQRLGRGARQRLLAAPPERLVLGSHADWAPLFRRGGLQLQSIDVAMAAAEQRRAVMERRLAIFALPNAPVVQLSDAVVARLEHCFGANLRAADHLMYEVFQQLQRRDAISSGDIEQLVLTMTADMAP